MVLYYGREKIKVQYKKLEFSILILIQYKKLEVYNLEPHNSS